MIRLLVSLLLASGCAHATPIVPSNDDEVVETLPAVLGGRAEERKLRRQLAAQPKDAATATAIAQRYLDQARDQGDPRFVGMALNALQAWPNPDQAPDDVLLMQATLQQYLHEFDAAARLLEMLLRRQPRAPQAWLTLATVRRVQGRYAESDAACRELAGLAAGVYAAACQAENDALRGNTEVARSSLQRLIAAPRLPAQTHAWLLTTLAELEERALDSAAAQAAYRAALAAQADRYTTLAYADFLLFNGRDAQALDALKGEPRTDAVLLRLAIAGTRIKAPDAARDSQEMRERIALANQRPGAQTLHAREQAMFALWVEREPARALVLARTNVRMQREPLDVLVLAHAARASGQAAALREVDRLRKEMGLHDRRLDSLL
ncbi:MAG: hypothetical protein JHC40_02515 [Burkholderiales bacterium]|jgi:predicted Zn-dependent protease|nr:hypothetical protein [Burkholderiales bacterium]